MRISHHEQNNRKRRCLEGCHLLRKGDKIALIGNNEIAIPITQNEGRERIYNSQVIYPIITDGDVVGSVILLSKQPNQKMGDAEDKVAQSAAGFLGTHLEI